MPLRPTSVSPPLPIYETKIDREALDAMPADARRNFFLFGHVANEIHTLYRLLVFSIKEQENQYLRAFAEARATTIARLLIGTTMEGFRAVEKSVIASPFGRTYTPHLPPDGLQAYAEVKRHLGDLKLLADIRNDFAFHLPKPTQIDDAYAKLPPEQELSILSGQARHSSLYVMSSVLMVRGMLDTAKADGSITDTDLTGRIIGDLLEKSKVLVTFIEKLLLTIMDREKLSPGVPAQVLTIDGYQSMFTFEIPPLLRS